MAITVDEQHNYHLQTQSTSYLMGLLENGELGHFYYGPRLAEPVNFAELRQRDVQSLEPVLSAEQADFSSDRIMQEYPGFGHGDFHYPAYQIQYENGARISEWQFVGDEITDGKLELNGLPSASAPVGDRHVQTLKVHFQEAQSGLQLTLNYTVFEQADVIVRSATFKNQGQQVLKVPRALSLALDLPTAPYDLLQLSGAWARERQVVRQPLHSGVQSVSSTRVASSAQQNPFIALLNPQATERSGSVYGINLIYSGNFLAQAEVDQDERTRVTIGINPFEFEWTLTPGQSFQTPEAMLTYADNGLSEMSHHFHQFLRQYLIPKRWVDEDRPILINNWEATYFDFNESKLVQFAQKAKQLGIELFVLDDGWFGKRDDDTTSLGDWQVNLQKLPHGLSGLAHQVHDLGLKFGLWFEPEMISIESQLYQRHPEWVIQVPERRMSPSRHQFILDFSRPEVVEAIFKQMASAINAAQLDYIKWDMNRYMTEAYSPALPAERQLEFGHRYILGVYQLYERLTKTFPNVLFESCASGGGRFDTGLLYYAPQAWTSDDTDAMERLRIQWGTSLVYPLNTMGAHVSAVPNAQINRVTSLATRGAVADFGDLGYELDITSLSAAARAEIAQQIKFYRQYRDLFQRGTFYRLQSPFAGNVTAWEVVSDDQQTAIVGRYQVLAVPNPASARICFTGLKETQLYRINDGPVIAGSQLMNAGLWIGQQTDASGALTHGDFASQLFVAKAVR
ncbi:alpha-galactosidase [Furfurilactobacillus curtus]|uniref:Alpha-galactosidase n=1 Tax=Furfurilactobacillus curtus TaxID=1746200 RepID=A0ABQ5JKQ0_9LACO